MDKTMDFDFEDEYPDKDVVPPLAPLIGPQNNSGNNRYRNAYGAYRGGYGPVGGRGGFGPHNMFRPPPPNFCPYPPNFYDSPGPGLWPRGPPFPYRPQRNEAIKYLIKCGVPREQLRNLPRDLLQMINPDYCGLCAVELDSFNLAKVHYNCKNHQKNVKKWLSSPWDYGDNSTPLKSRDSYCELCDVEITSKAHSDSHYSGKSHRTIVLGRKNPKNPLLLQPGMEDRVKRLIRREKRCLGRLEEVEEEKPKPDNKFVPPELYCDICKTFVTCSEQMTIHLNGKRHLTKEKQHILKMMRGETTSDGQATSVDKDPEDFEDGNEDASAHKDDWENNGEKWDDQEPEN